jgi:hypothetical protein
MRRPEGSDDGPCDRTFPAVRRSLARACRAECVRIGFLRLRDTAAGARKGMLGRAAREQRRRASRALLGRLLAQASGGRHAPSLWTLTRGATGRIEASGPLEEIEVSLAYAGEIVVAVATAGRPIGIDPEVASDWSAPDRPDELLSVHERVLVGADQGRFLTVWTLKEALAKERGAGLIDGAAHLDVARLALARPERLLGRDDGGLALHAGFRLAGRRYQLAIALGPRRA